MGHRPGRFAFALAAILLAGCAFVPRTYPRLDEANAALSVAAADPTIACFAAAELRDARDTLDRARLARDTLDDPALVDHLAYIAKQRIAIAAEIAKAAAVNRACP
jgi:hypothetical protein